MLSNYDHVIGLATTLANFMFPDVSDNRRRGELSTPDLEAYRANMHSNQNQADLDLLRHGSGGNSRAELLAYGNKVVARGNLGNCMEIACAGAASLERKGVTNWHLVKYKSPYDHVFLAVGEVGTCPDDFDNWADKCAIFDGWAQIACLATNYKLKWNAKMDAWTNSRTYKVILPHPAGATTMMGDATNWKIIVGKPKVILDT